MTKQTVNVYGISVRVDSSGRYNLNDLHAAAVAEGNATESQRPSVFARSAQTKRFVKALRAKASKSALEENQSLNIVTHSPRIKSRDPSQKRPLRTPSRHGALGYGRSGEQRSLF